MNVHNFSNIIETWSIKPLKRFTGERKHFKPCQFPDNVCKKKALPNCNVDFPLYIKNPLSTLL